MRVNCFFEHRFLNILNSLMDSQTLNIHQTGQNIQTPMFEEVVKTEG
jgi:hypothetical protein